MLLSLTTNILHELNIIPFKHCFNTQQLNMCFNISKVLSITRFINLIMFEKYIWLLYSTMWKSIVNSVQVFKQMMTFLVYTEHAPSLIYTLHRPSLPLADSLRWMLGLKLCGLFGWHFSVFIWAQIVVHILVKKSFLNLNPLYN